MRLRKFTRVITFILVILGAIGGVGFMIPTNKSVQSSGKAPSQSDYASEKAFAASFADVYLTMQKSDTADSRGTAIEPFAGNAGWVGQDPAITNPPGVVQTVLQVLPGEQTELDSHHIIVPVLVHLDSNSVERWLKLTVPVGILNGEMNVYAPPTLSRAFHGVGTATDKTWSGDAAPANVTSQIQTVLTSFMPLYFSSSSMTGISQYLASGTQVEPRDGLLSFVSLDNMNVYGTDTGPWIAVADVQVMDPITKVRYEEELAIGLEQRAGHDQITGIVVN